MSDASTAMSNIIGILSFLPDIVIIQNGLWSFDNIAITSYSPKCLTLKELFIPIIYNYDFDKCDISKMVKEPIRINCNLTWKLYR